MSATSDIAIVDAELLSRIPESELRGSKVIAIDGNSDPIRQIDMALEGLTSISVLRIVSHGGPGALWLGGQRIDTETLRERTSEIGSWGLALTADADLLLYGCSVADTAAGADLIQTLADLTGADVAASSNVTGIGGDTLLEKSSGPVEHGLKTPIQAWTAVGLNLAFTSLTTATFYAEQGNTFTLMTDHQETSQFHLASGSLPAGISFDPAHGALYGVPAKGEVGIYHLTFSAKDGMTIEDQALTLKILDRNENSPDADGGYNYARPQVSNFFAMAALNSDGSIASWGDDRYGGTGAPAGHDFVSVVAGAFGFAALRKDGSIATWPNSNSGESQCPTDGAYRKILPIGPGYAAFKEDGNVAIWNQYLPFGEAPSRLHGVVDIVTNGMATAALKDDGTIIAWGEPSRGGAGFPTESDFSAIFPTNEGFIGLRKNGSIAVWGLELMDSTAAPIDSGYVKIVSNGDAHVGLKPDGEMAAWGLDRSGGTGAPILGDILKVYPLDNGFLALDRSGRIYAWGTSGIAPPLNAEENAGFVSLQIGGGSFSALRQDGSLFSWGNWDSVNTTLPVDNGYTKVIYNNGAFLALRSDGSLATWGDPRLLNWMPSGNHRFVDIFSTDLGFTAIDGNGFLTNWGDRSGNAPKDGGYVRVFTAGAITAAMKADGTIASWGDPYYVGQPPTRNGFVAFASPYEQAPYFPISVLSEITAVQNADAFYRIPAEGIPAPTFSIASGKLPEGLSFDVTSGVISGRATGKTGTYAVTISLENGYGNISKAISIHVISSLPKVKNAVTVRVGQFGTSSLFETSLLLDVDLQPLDGFDLEDSGLMLDASTGILTGNPRAGLGGQYRLKVVYPDLITSAPVAFFDLTVLEAPKFTTIPRVEFSIGEANTFTVMAQGYPKPDIQWQSGSAPPGIQLDPATGILSGTPPAGTAGTYQLSFAIESPFYERVVQTLTLTVSEKTQQKTVASSQSFAALASDGSLFSWPQALGAYPAGDGFVEIASNGSAFAALKNDGSIKAWGQAAYGGTGAPTGKGYIKIFSNGRAFAALTKDGHIASWGDAVDASAGPQYLSAPLDGGYVDIVSNSNAFVAIKADGSIATWGLRGSGGFGGPTGPGFKKVVAGPVSFVALKNDGTVFSWGTDAGSMTSAPTDDGYIQVFANAYGFAALKTDGSIATWGMNSPNGNALAPSGKGYTTIVANDYAFAALKSDGSIYAWGLGDLGGSGAPTTSGFVTLIANQRSFAALSQDGSVTSWGFLSTNANAAPAGNGFVQVFGNGNAFAALRSDGSIKAWGNPDAGGDGAPGGAGFRTIVPNSLGFAALKADGSITSWGDLNIRISPSGTGFTKVVANRYAFAALKQDGTIQAWGQFESGGSLVPPARKFVSFATPQDQLPWVSVTKSPNFSAQLNQSFSTLAPIRGYPFASISISKGALPPGIQFDQQSGLLFGKPSKLGNYSFTLTAENGLKSVSLNFQFKVVAAFNDPPTGRDATLTSLEDQVVVLKELDFGFADGADLPANGFLSVKIVTLPAKGILSLGGKAVAVNQEIPIAAIRAGKLAYLPPKNAAGDAFAKFTFRNRDNGGKQGGGNDVAVAANTITFQIKPVSDAPTGKDKTIAIAEDSDYAIGYFDFGFSDPSDSPANAFSSLLITSLPARGTLTLFGAPVEINQEIPVVLLGSGGLIFTPTPQTSGAGYATLTFKVRDSGNTESGGVNLDPTPKKLVWNVASVNDAPQGTDKAITSFEDKAYKFVAADFKLTDPNDTPANTLASVQIVSLPERGVLSLGGRNVKAGQEIFVQDINAGKFAYTPPADANGNDLAGFAFKVRDNGGTARSGVNLAVDANRITFTVTAVNDAPTAINQRLTVSKAVPFIFTLDQFALVDAKDIPPNGLSRVQFTVLPAKGKGTLSLNGVALKVNAFVSVADIVAGKLKYALPSTAKGKGFATISFKVEDDGGTANGGKNLALAANVLTIDVA